nr:MAG TPA: hypothetical protein [Caudoviricetes sp.]
MTRRNNFHTEMTWGRVTTLPFPIVLLNERR